MIFMLLWALVLFLFGGYSLVMSKEQRLVSYSNLRNSEYLGVSLFVNWLFYSLFFLISASMMGVWLLGLYAVINVLATAFTSYNIYEKKGRNLGSHLIFGKVWSFIDVLYIFVFIVFALFHF